MNNCCVCGKEENALIYIASIGFICEQCYQKYYLKGV
jgi:NMD protein affecting ribosome stability and mRNA decay